MITQIFTCFCFLFFYVNVAPGHVNEKPSTQFAIDQPCSQDLSLSFWAEAKGGVLGTRLAIDAI